MPLDGNGSFSPPAPQFPAIPNTVIYADDFNQIILDIATALSTAIFRDGQAAFTANQSMGGFRLTNLADGVSNQDATTVVQVFVNPTFTGTDTDGVTVAGTRLTVTTTDVKLPADVTIGTVTAADIATLPNLAPKASPTFTGIPKTPLAAPSTSTDQIASTAFVTQAIFAASLPSAVDTAWQLYTLNASLRGNAYLY